MFIFNTLTHAPATIYRIDGIGAQIQWRTYVRRINARTHTPERSYSHHSHRASHYELGTVYGWIRCVCACASCVYAFTNAFCVIENVCRISIVTRTRKRKIKETKKAKNMIFGRLLIDWERCGKILHRCRSPFESNGIGSFSQFFICHFLEISKTLHYCDGDLLCDHVFVSYTMLRWTFAYKRQIALALSIWSARRRKHVFDSTNKCEDGPWRYTHIYNVYTYYIRVKCGQNKWILLNTIFIFFPRFRLFIYFIRNHSEAKLTEKRCDEGERMRPMA